jgi:hypothetical protein
MSQEPQRIQLADDTKGTATWVYFDEAGRLTVELYDFSEDARASSATRSRFFCASTHPRWRRFENCGEMRPHSPRRWRNDSGATTR